MELIWSNEIKVRQIEPFDTFEHLTLEIQALTSIPMQSMSQSQDDLSIHVLARTWHDTTKDVMQQGRMSRFDTSFSVRGEENGAMTIKTCQGIGRT